MVTTSRGAGMAAAIIGAAAVFFLSLAAPITIDTDSGSFTSKIANAKNNGGNGGGNGGGNNSGGNGKGKGKGKGNDVASTRPDGDRKLLLPLVPEPAITVALFTTKIAKRYPADEITNLENRHQAISFFSELQDMSGQKITHRWIHGGEVAFKASFQVRANHWRIWSTQLLPADMPGEWKVEIVNEQGDVLEFRTLNFAPKDAVLAEN
jgi:hypothetical protein